MARRGNWAERVVLRFLSSEVAARAGEGMNSLVMPAVGQGQMREGGQELGDKRRTERLAEDRAARGRKRMRTVQCHRG